MKNAFCLHSPLESLTSRWIRARPPILAGISHELCENLMGKFFYGDGRKSIKVVAHRIDKFSCITVFGHTIINYILKSLN